VRAGGQHDLAGPDVPDPLPGHALRGGVGQVVGAMLDGEHVVVVVVAEGGGAGQDDHLRRGRQFRGDPRHPVQGRGAVDGLVAAGQQRAAELRLLVDEDDARPGAGGHRRRGQAGRTGADDEDVGVHELLVVDRLVRGRVEPAEPGERPGTQPVDRDTVVAVSIDSEQSPATCSSALGSSTPAARMPRGRSR
jgi:hypothetical protein